MDLAEVKCNIRSVLLSSPKGCSLRQFAEDYRTMIGEIVPYRQFDYKDIEDFLIHLNDVVHISMYQGAFVLTGIADSNTQHIQNMVRKQKKGISGYRDPYSDIRRTGGGHRVNRPVRSNNSQPPRPAAYVPPRFRVLPILEKQRIKELVCSYPIGLKWEDFHRAYSQKYGVTFDPKSHAFSDLKECILSISDLVRLIPNQDSFILVARAY